MSRILVATDGSAGADRSIDYAARWAKRVGAELVIANVIGGEGIPESVVEAFTHAQQAWFKEMLASASATILTKARERAKSAGVPTILLESRAGEVAPAILGIAEEQGAEAIVVGKRGAGRIAGLLIGSISQKLVSLAPLPVTVVP